MARDKEKKRAYNRAYYAANREKFRAYNRAYKEANREKRLASDRAYKEANREKLRAYSRTDAARFSNLRSKARVRNVTVAMTFDQYVDLYQRECFYHRGPCAWSETGYGIDRRRSDEGYTLENSVRCCAPCNYEKGQMESSAYLAVWRWRHRHGVMDWHDPRLEGVLPGKVKKDLEQGEDE